MRLEHFKHQASLHTDKTVKELMYGCGFTSRATFYRNFPTSTAQHPLNLLRTRKKNHFPASKFHTQRIPVS
ncbi:MAG: helix-turn-helix domain-containing protein [Bacteroides sp.]|nr:helix-turn-helix domain-containing protein [Bacteroides sp.]